MSCDGVRFRRSHASASAHAYGRILTHPPLVNSCPPTCTVMCPAPRQQGCCCWPNWSMLTPTPTPTVTYLNPNHPYPYLTPIGCRLLLLPVLAELEHDVEETLGQPRHRRYLPRVLCLGIGRHNPPRGKPRTKIEHRVVDAHTHGITRTPIHHTYNHVFAHLAPLPAHPGQNPKTSLFRRARLSSGSSAPTGCGSCSV